VLVAADEQAERAGLGWLRLRAAILRSAVADALGNRDAARTVLAWAVAGNRATEPKQMGPEKRLFAFSILYLFGLFGALVADKWLLP